MQTHKFQSLGESYHFVIENHNDLKTVLDLDEALWVATTAPSATIKSDDTFLEMLDSDRDGRIRAEEIKDAIRFVFANLSDYSGIRPLNTVLPLAHINRADELGRRIHSSAEKVLKKLGESPDTVNLEQLRKVKNEVLHGGLDQAGIVLGEAADDELVADFIDNMLDTVGGAEHNCGRQGVDKNAVNAFLAESSAYISWLREAGDIGGDEKTTIRPLGAQTDEAYALFTAISEKLYQYFLLCDISQINPGLIERSLDNPERGTAVDLMQIEAAKSYLAGAPLSLLSDTGALDLKNRINPYFKQAIDDFSERVVEPLLGSEVTTITKADYGRLREVFVPYAKWIDRKPDVRVAAVDAALLAAYSSDPLYRETIEYLIEQSHETAFVLENLKELERLILYRANLLPLVNSFVSFPHLYDPSSRALFEEGTLVMDGRHFTMAVKVADRKHHIEMSKNSHIFVIYCELSGTDGEKLYEIAVPVTSGSRGSLHLHKWGIFNDVNGNEHHARIVDIVENPISVAEAVVAPFIRVKQAFHSRIEEFSSKAEEQLFKKKEAGQAPDGFATPLLGIGGVAVAALGSSVAFITKTVAAMSMQTVLVAMLVIGAILIIPSAFSAYIKLAKRDLSTILEGSGWGLNSRMILNRTQAETFTFRPGRPSR